MSYKQRFLTEGVHEDHPAVAVVAIGRGAWLGQVVLGERQRMGVSNSHPTSLTLHEHTGHSAALCECR